MASHIGILKVIMRGWTTIRKLVTVNQAAIYMATKNQPPMADPTTAHTKKLGVDTGDRKTTPVARAKVTVKPTLEAATDG